MYRAITAGMLVLGCGPGPQRPVAVGPTPVVKSEPAAAAAPVVAAAPVEVEAPVKVVDDGRVPVFEVAVIEGRVRARRQGLVGSIEAPPVPRRFCCEWTARAASTVVGATSVDVSLTLACDGILERCEGVVAEPPEAQVTVPLIKDAPVRPRYRGLPDSVVERMPGALGPKQQLANMLSAGPFGPTSDGVLVLHVDDVGALGGFLHTEVDGAARRVPVPPLPWVMHEVSDVVYADADGDGADEAVVLVNALTGIGPTAAEEFAGAHVLKWDGTQLVTLAAAEQRLAGATKAAQVRARLQRGAR